MSYALAKNRPSRLSMEGYIFNADAVLQDATEGNYPWGVPKQIVQDCKGVVVLNVFEFGALLSFHYGTGVMMAKRIKKIENKEDAIEWSPPVSVYMGGWGMGPIGGGKVDSVLTFIMDDETMKDFAEVPQTRIGVNAALSCGRKGGDMGKGFDLSATKTFVFTNGIWVGSSLKLGTLTPARGQTETFYKQSKGKLNVADVLFKEGTVTLPADNQIDMIYEKLDYLSRGEIWKPGNLNRSKHFLEKAQEKSTRFVRNSQHAGAPENTATEPDKMEEQEKSEQEKSEHV